MPRNYFIRNNILATSKLCTVKFSDEMGQIGVRKRGLALTVIDRLGRKTLLMVGSAGMVAALAATAWIQWSGSNRDLLLWALILFIAAFAFSQGAVIWVYIAEIFPTEVRARGQSLGASTHWLMDAIVASVFPAMAARSTGLPFVLFALAMLVQLLVVARYFVETKGVRLEDIDVSFEAVDTGQSGRHLISPPHR